ncbi:MAG: hypothetical protein FWG39_03740, partial [Alphaproteobacteria bacterium]|nr:hypothetical protein [Alphaproteobacteria bacterium]
GILADVAKYSKYESVAMAAFEKITDEEVLEWVAEYSKYESVAMAAFEKITDKNALEWVAKYSKYESVVLAAVEKITDEEVLARVAKYSEHESVAKAAVEKIMNEERLGSVANYSKYESVAKAAFEKITDNNILADVAEYSKYESVAMAAFEKITDEEVLEWVAEYSEYESVAMAAFEKIMNGERLGSVAKAAKEKKEAEKKKREKEELAEKKKREKEELVEKKKREKEAAAKAKADKKRAAKEKAAQDESRKKKAGLMAVIAKMEQDAEKGAPETADVTDGSETAKTPYIHSDLRSLNLTRLIVLYRMGKISGDDINDDVTDDPEKTAEIFARIGKMSPEEEKEFARLVVVELFDNPSSKESLINLLPPETLADAYNGLKEQIGGKNDTRYSDAVLKEFIKKLADHMDGRSINFDRDIAQKKAYEPESLSNFCDASEKMFDARRPDLRKFLDNKKIKQIDKNKQKIKQILKEIDEFHGLDEMPPKDDAVTAPDKEREIEKQYEDLVKRLAELDPDPETLKDASKYKFLDKKGNVIPQFRDEKNKKSAEYKPGCKVDKKSKLFDIIELVRAAIARTNMAKPETPTREWLRDEMNKQLMFELFNAVHADKIRKMVLENPEQFSDPKEVIRISDELRQTGGEISELAYQAIMNDHGKRTEGFAFRLKQKLGGGGKIFGELVAKLFKPIEKIDKRREKSEKETEEDMHDATDGIDFGFSDMTDGSDGIDITDPEIVDVADGSKIADDADAETDGAAKDVLKSAIARKNRAKRIELVKKILIGGGVAFLTSAAITTIAAAAVATAGLSVAASVAVIGVVTSISMAGWQIQKWRKRQRDKGLPDDMNAMLKDKKMMASLGTTALALFAMLFGAAGLTAAAMYLGYGALVLGAGGGAVAMFKDAKASGLSAVESMMWALANVIATVGGGIGGRMFANAQINAYNERNPENTVFQTKETTETTVKEPDQTKTRTETETVYKSGAVDSSENILKGWYKSNPDLLESRLDSLMSQGMSRDDAIRYLLVAHDAGARIPTNLTFQDGSHGNNMFVGPKVFEAQGITNDMRLDLVNSINGDTVNLTDSVRSTFNTMNPAISGNNQVGPFPGAPTGPYSPYVEHSGSMETITKTVTEIIPGETKTITNTEFNSVKVPWGLGTMGLHGLFGGDKEPEETRDAPVEKPKKEKTEKTKKPKKTKTDAPKEKTTKFWNPFGGGKKVKKSEAFQRGAEIINAMQQLGERYEKAAAMADRFRDDLTGHGKIEVKTLNSGINYIEKLIKTGGLDKENKKAARSLLDMLKLESKKNGK